MWGIVRWFIRLVLWRSLRIRRRVGGTKESYIGLGLGVDGTHGLYIVVIQVPIFIIPVDCNPEENFLDMVLA